MPCPGVARIAVATTDGAACLPDPAFLGEEMTGKTCAGLYVTGKDKSGADFAT